MAIAKKPNSNQNDNIKDKAADAFIAGAAKPAAANGGRKRIPTMLRFDPDLLGRIDAAAKRRGISRSAWIQYTLSCALDDDRSGTS